MLPKMQESRFVKKYSVQFVDADGKAVGAFYFSDKKPHECSKTWQVVRSEFDQTMLNNAREHGVEVDEAFACRSAVRGGRAVGVKIRRRTDRTAKSAPRWSWMRADRRPDPEPAQTARLGSGAQKGRYLDLLGRRLPRHRPRRRRDDGPQTANRRAGSGISRCTTNHQRRRGCAVR